jgi:hypothetical protein
MESVKIAIKGSTQEHLRVADIMGDLVILKDGSATLVLQVSAVNFGLLSEDEQASIIFAYAGLLNSLNFAIQVVVRSQQKDISSYMELLADEEKKQANPLLKEQIGKYREFIGQTVKENNVLDKKFYIAIPFSFLELGVSTSASGVLGLGKRKRNKLPMTVEQIVEKAKVSLEPKRDHILRQLGRIGLRARQLSTEELIDLFYDIYNHDKVMATRKEPDEEAKTDNGFEPMKQ